MTTESSNFMLESFISIMDGSHTYHQISGIFKGHQEKIEKYLERMAINIERLSENILYAPNAISVKNISKPRQQYIEDLREVRQSLEPVQRAVGEKILSSAIISTPEKMHKALKKNPWKVLMNIHPVTVASCPSQADMTPILFNYDGIQYIGWQMRGTLPILFDCEYNELWLNRSKSHSSEKIGESESSQSLPKKLLYTLQGHRDWVNSVAVSPDGRILASGSEDNTIKLWDMKTGKILRTFKKGWWQKGHEGPVRTVIFSPDGYFLVSGSDDNTIKFWELKTGKVRRILVGNGLWVRSLAFSPDGRILASECEMIKLWEVRTGKTLFTLDGKNTMAFSPDGRILASGGPNNAIKLWEVDTAKEIDTLEKHGNAVTALAFSPDGSTLASGSEDDTIKLWDLRTGKQRCTLVGHEHSVFSVVFHPDGQTLTSASGDDTIKHWDINTGQELYTLYGHDCTVNSIAFSPNGRILLSASNDKTVKLWQ
jgi:WD40 repeat protein